MRGEMGSVIGMIWVEQVLWGVSKFDLAASVSSTNHYSLGIQ